MPDNNATVWRITVEDAKMVLEQRYPNLTKEQMEFVLQEVIDEFCIPDWEDHLDYFISEVIANEQFEAL